MIHDVDDRPTSSATSNAVVASDTLTQFPEPRSFTEIISDYWSKENRGSALDYLKSLDSKELRTLGREHGFTDPGLNLYGLSIDGSDAAQEAECLFVTSPFGGAN